MRIRLIAVALVWASVLRGQSHFSWQEYCFKSPSAPVCHANDYAVKRPAGAKNTAPKNTASKAVVTNPSPSVSQKAAPSLIAIGQIDWRFADPFADALVGMNVNGLTSSPLAHAMIDQLGAKQGLAEADLQKLFDGLSGVEQVALSVHGNRIVAMITGSVTNSNLPSPEAGLKAVPVSGGSLLAGHADAVDQAIARIAAKGPPSDLMRLAEAWQASGEFWATGAASLIGPQAVSAGVRRFSLIVSLRSRLTSDLAFEFSGPPNANTLRSWQSQAGPLALEGNTVHIRTSTEAAQVQQRFAEIAAGPLGQPLSALIAAARYLPVRETSVPRQTRPVIYGLDEGPKEVGPPAGR